MKLIFSMPAVPSATPAHENSAWIGPPHSSSAFSMLALSRRSRSIALAPASVTGAKSITTTSAPRSCTSSATAAPMPVAPPTTSARLPSYRNASNRPIVLTPRFRGSAISGERKPHYRMAMPDDLGSPALRFEREGSLAWCTIDRPSARNALTPAMYYGIKRAVRLVNRDPDLAALIITGTGDVFAPGGELGG